MVKKILGMILFGWVSSVSALVYEFNLGETIPNDQVSGGSGIVAYGGDFYVIGDDTTWFFKLNDEFDVEKKSRLLVETDPAKSDEQDRLPGNKKPDYEAISKVEWDGKQWAIVLGSGGSLKLRERGHMVRLDNPEAQKKNRSMGILYGQLKSLAGLLKKPSSKYELLNLEGLVTTGKFAYIFHRGNFTGKSLIFRINESELIEYMLNERDYLSQIHVVEVILPTIDKSQAALSGGGYSSKNETMVFSASIESNGGMGDTVGSFIGVLPEIYFEDAIEGGGVIDLRPLSQLVQRDGKPVVTKVESVAITSDSENSIEGVLVSDNDNGASEFFETKFSIDVIYE